VFEQHQVGRLLGDVDGCVDRDAHVRRMQWRRVVDTVSEVADDVAARLQCPHDAVLLLGRDAAKEIGALGRCAQAGIIHRGDLHAGEHAGDGDLKHRAQVPRD